MSDAVDDIVQKLEQKAESLPSKKNQCTQHLLELGYLPISMANALTDKKIESAKVRFLEEAIDSGLFPFTEFQMLTSEDTDELLSSLLEKATDIDEGFVFSELPELGVTNLATRILHYRLDIFGLWPFAINQTFDVLNSKAQLQKLGAFLQCDMIKALNYAADVEKMTKQILETHPEEDFVLTFKPLAEVDASLRKKLDKTRKFKRQLLEDFGEKTEYFKYLRKEVLKENPQKVDFNFLNAELKKPFKRFIMRLIQVHQWQDGLYQGLLDSDMGELSIHSILRTNELFNSVNKKRIPSFRILTHVVNDYYLFNALFFLQEYMVDEDDINNPEDQIVSDLMQNIQSANDHQLSAFELNMNVIKAEVAIASLEKPKERKGFLQRVYFGVKKFFRKIAKISKKIFEWVAFFIDKFNDLLKKVFGPLLSKLSKGIKAFITGIKFLLGRQGTITANEDSMIASVIRLDGDCYNIQSGPANTKLITEHNVTVQYHVKSLHFSLAIVGGVMKVVMNSLSILSWPLLLMTIIKTVKSISESYQKLNIVTN